MQSSPPTRAWERPSSPADSQYSLDLGALGLDGGSGASSPVAKQRVDRVLSEDIDGPSDFTLNMADWIRGGTMGKGTMRSARSALQTLKEHEANARDGAHSQHLEIPQSPSQKEADIPEEEHTASHHTPSNSPPKESVWDSQLRQESGEQGSSEWDPYGEASTPHPPPHKQFLQPTVEDYYSELTPARMPAAQAHESPEQQDSPTEAHVSPSKISRSSTPGRASSPTLSPLRSPVISRSLPAPISSPFDRPPDSRAEVDSQLPQLQARCQQLEHLNSALKQALDEEQRIRKREKTAFEAQLHHAARREKDLTEMKEEAYKRADDFRSEFAEQKVHLRDLEAQAANREQEFGRQDRHQREEVEMLRNEVEAERAAHQRESQGQTRELELARRGRADAEELARVHREELDEARDMHDGEVQRFRLELQQVEDARDNIQELEGELSDTKRESSNLRAAKSDAEDMTAMVEKELASLKQRQDEETTRITADQHRAAELAGRLQNELKELQQQRHNERTSHEAEISQLQTTHAQAQEKTTSELTTLRTDSEAQQSLLNDATLDRDAAQDSLAALQTSQQDLQALLEGLRAELADSGTVNAALDARIADAVRRRESYWRGRLEESERERGVMGKALLRQWGREEVGVQLGRPEQGYEYRYLTRSPVKTAT